MNTHDAKDLQIEPVFLWFPRFVEDKLRWFTTVGRYRVRHYYTESTWEYVLRGTVEGF